MFHPLQVNLTSLHKLGWVKHSAHLYASDCDDNVQSWGTVGGIFALIISSIGTVHSLKTVNELGCWLAKQINATSSALTGMLTDIDNARHATLQNRAAIDCFAFSAWTWL